MPECIRTKAHLEITSSPEQTEPRSGGGLFLHGDSVFDLFILELDEWVARVTAAVVFGDNLDSLLVPTFGNEPSGRFRDEPDQAELDQ